MSKALKEIAIGEKALTVVQLDPWQRLAFVADLQKDFLAPLLKNAESSDLNALFTRDGNGGVDVLALISAFTSAIDGQRLEKWTRRILTDGMVIYTRPDGQRAKLSFGELNKFFSHPAHIVLLLKEAIVWNLADLNELVGTLVPKKAASVAEAS
ncbi:phage tail assembly chaperone [Intestinirhabdus alba]|jgi:hypothetical protein|uniref:Uncharacterized protein n=1 Tax=Intestinirhabdus alba TaxID=2899544 RepID=A0A6L6IFX6_9ENTR|nr:hypothetical protein [Intestinirhabdus alba]MTH44935.1 hypothetical protein [Intestinirhabdus alba]